MKKLIFILAVSLLVWACKPKDIIPPTPVITYPYADSYVVAIPDTAFESFLIGEFN